jgi:hypothetical protein
MRISEWMPQTIVVLLNLVSLLLYAHDHGKPKTGKDNFWLALLTSLISVALLWWGGFFNGWLGYACR